MQKNSILIIILIIISIITHLEWFNFGNILFFSDWTHWNTYSTNDLVNFGFGPWFNHFGFGTQNVQLYLNFFEYIWGVIGNYEIATKITFFIPIALLSFLSPYFFTKYYTKNEIVSFLIALFFGLNTHLLVKETAHMPLAFLMVISPLIIIYFDKFLKDLNIKNTLYFSIIYFIGICYEVRVMYIITILLILYIIFIHIYRFKDIDFYKYFGLFILFQILLNIFWLLPIILGGGNEAISDVANRGLFGNQLFTLHYALNIFENSRTGLVPNQDFIPQKIPFYFWFYPILVFVGTLFIKKQEKESQKLMFFGLVISILGILLTKQSAEPFPGLYLWLYENFPGFNLFREAGKFYIVTLIGYTLILGIFLNYLYKNYKKVFYIIGAIIILISIVIAKPLITKEIGTIFIEKIEPIEYKNLNKYIKNDDLKFKTLWIPRVSQWGIYDMKNPKTSLIDILDKEYKDFNNYENKRNYQDFSSFMFEPLENSTEILNVSGIRYLIIGLKDLENQDDFFRFYGSTPEQYYEKLKQIKGIEELKLDGLGDVKLFENKNYLTPVFFSEKLITKDSIDSNKYSKIDSKLINPTLYELNSGDFKSGYINLSQAKNSNWKLIEGEFKWYDIIFGDVKYINGEKGQLDFLNSWKIENIENKKISLYFVPQSYFILGIIISVTTFVLLILWLFILIIISRKNKILNNIEIGNKQ